MIRISDIIAIILLCFLSVEALSCDFGNDITKNEDGTYTYSRECHILVGNKLNELKLRKEEIAELRISLKLKDLALTEANTRIDLWKNQTLELESRINSQDKWSKYNNWINIGIGIGLTVASGWALGQIK
jgi:hypothetical protein